MKPFSIAPQLPLHYKTYILNEYVKYHNMHIVPRNVGTTNSMSAYNMLYREKNKITKEKHGQLAFQYKTANLKAVN